MTLTGSWGCWGRWEAQLYNAQTYRLAWIVLQTIGWSHSACKIWLRACLPWQDWADPIPSHSNSFCGLWGTVSFLITGDLFDMDEQLIAVPAGVWCPLSVVALLNVPVLCAWSPWMNSMILLCHLHPNRRNKPKPHSVLGKKAELWEKRSWSGSGFVPFRCVSLNCAGYVERILSQHCQWPPSFQNIFWFIPFSDPHLALSFDRLHSLHLGLWVKHIFEEIKKILKYLGRAAETMVEK